MEALLEVHEVTVSRGGRRVLDRVSLRVDEGEIVALIGPNGSGKTTLLEVIVGARRASAGYVLGRGRPLQRLRDRADLIAWQADAAMLAPEVVVARVLEGAADPSDELQLSPLSSRRVGCLSRGERYRVALAEALHAGRPLVVLDEPLAAFDALQLRAVARVLRRRAEAGTAFVLSVHHLESALRIADRCVVLHAGRVLAAGTEADLRREAEVPDGPLDDVLVALASRKGGDGAP